MATLQDFALNLRIKTLGMEAAGEIEKGDQEPFLWITFFKIDGDTVILNKELQLQGSAVVEPRSQLRFDGMNAGASRTIPAVWGQDSLLRPGFNTRMKPIPLEVPIFGITHVGGVVGCAVVLWEADGTPYDARDAGHLAFAETLRAELNKLIPKLGITQPQPTPEQIAKIEGNIHAGVEKAIKSKIDVFDWLFAPFGDFDDFLGAASFLFAHEQVQDAPDPIPIAKDWSNDETGKNGAWFIRGFVDRSSGCLASDSGADESHLRALRRVRDERLHATPWGPSATDAYAVMSSAVSPALHRSPTLRWATKHLLIEPAARVAGVLFPSRVKAPRRRPTQSRSARLKAVDRG